MSAPPINPRAARSEGETPADPVVAPLGSIVVGQALPERSFTPTIAELFLYSAIIWNAHRIHYDLAYTRESEGYPGLLITGPLQGDWLCQCVTDWAGAEGVLERFVFTHRQGAYLGDTLTTGGRVTACDPAGGQVTLSLHIHNQRGEVVTPGEALVRFPVP